MYNFKTKVFTDLMVLMSYDLMALMPYDIYKIRRSKFIITEMDKYLWQAKAETGKEALKQRFIDLSA